MVGRGRREGARVRIQPFLPVHALRVPEHHPVSGLSPRETSKAEPSHVHVFPCQSAPPRQLSASSCPTGKGFYRPHSAYCQNIIPSMTIPETVSPPPLTRLLNSSSALHHQDEARFHLPLPECVLMEAILFCAFYKTHSPEKGGGCNGNISSIGDGCKTMEMYLMPPNCTLKIINKEILCYVYLTTISKVIS